MYNNYRHTAQQACSKANKLWFGEVVWLVQASKPRRSLQHATQLFLEFTTQLGKTAMSYSPNSSVACHASSLSDVSVRRCVSGDPFSPNRLGCSDQASEWVCVTSNLAVTQQPTLKTIPLSLFSDLSLRRFHPSHKTQF